MNNSIVIKRNRMEISVKGLMLAVVVIISCVLAAIALYMVERGKTTMNSGNEQYSSMMSQYTELDKTIYDGLNVSGNDVIELIDKLADDSQVTVHVYTLLNQKTGKSYVNSKYDISSKTNIDYINLFATFIGSVTRNINGIVTDISFNQKAA